MKRVHATWLLAAAALALGVLTAARAAENRARADELDQLERWCEAQGRRNELQRLALERAEWQLLAQKPASPGGEVAP